MWDLILFLFWVLGRYKSLKEMILKREPHNVPLIWIGETRGQ